MSKFRCVCGEVLTTSGAIPNRDEWLYISDVDYIEHWDQVDADQLYRTFGRAYVCPRSGHIWVFKDGLANDPTGYAPLER